MQSNYLIQLYTLEQASLKCESQIQHFYSRNNIHEYNFQNVFNFV